MSVKNRGSRKVPAKQQSHREPGLSGSSDTPENDTGSVSSSRDCEIVAVGKRRDGGTRYWCLRHRADATAKYGRPADICRASNIPTIRLEDTLSLNIDKYKGGVALWGAVPAVYDTTRLPMDRGIHVHARLTASTRKEMDRTFRAVRILSSRLPKDGILISELDAIYYMVSSIFGYQMKHIKCTYCSYAHLDRDWFSVRPHRRHLCAGCGRHFYDTETAIGNPISGARRACGVAKQRAKLSRRTLHVKQKEFPGGIQIWGSNPAFIWTSKLAEEEGIHVHAFRETGDQPELDETYGKVAIDGVNLNPLMVRVLMAQSALPSLKNRVLPISCPACCNAQFEVGEFAYTPAAAHICKRCGHEFMGAGRLRKTIANPLPGILKRLAEKAPRKPQQHDLGLLQESL